METETRKVEKLATQIDAVDVCRMAIIEAMKTEKWMVVVWRVQNGKLEWDRTTWNFPNDKLREAVAQLEESCREEVKKAVPELDPLPLAGFLKTGGDDVKPDLMAGVQEGALKSVYKKKELLPLEGVVEVDAGRVIEEFVFADGSFRPEVPDEEREKVNERIRAYQEWNRRRVESVQQRFLPTGGGYQPVGEVVDHKKSKPPRGGTAIEPGAGYQSVWDGVDDGVLKAPDPTGSLQTPPSQVSDPACEAEPQSVQQEVPKIELFQGVDKDVEKSS